MGINFKKFINIIFTIILLIILTVMSSRNMQKILLKNVGLLVNSNSIGTFNPVEKKIVYLTFDDGPTKVVTDNLLDILKEYNVKATFFVVGKEIPGRETILKRIYDEGHSIGLHTYSHNEKKIYSNPQTFIDEMIKTREMVKEITGCECNIIRFPWGSYNQYFHLNQNMIDTLHKQNFKIYDWNCNLEDGIYPNLSTDKLVRNSKKYKTDYPDIIVLMHCNFNNKNTVKALPEIINYYKDLGYDFKRITEETPEYYYKFKN